MAITSELLADIEKELGVEQAVALAKDLAAGGSIRAMCRVTST